MLSALQQRKATWRESQPSLVGLVRSSSMSSVAPLPILVPASSSGAALPAGEDMVWEQTPLRCLIADDSNSSRKILRHMLTKRLNHTAEEVKALIVFSDHNQYSFSSLFVLFIYFCSIMCSLIFPCNLSILFLCLVWKTICVTGARWS